MNLFLLLLLLLLGIGIIVASLLFAKRYPSAAQCIRLVFSMLAAGCLRMAQLCKHGCVKCLTLVSPNRDRTDTSFLVGVAVSRVFYLLISSLVFAALPFEILRFGHFFSLPGEGPTYGNLFVWIGLCAFVMPIIWALVLWEAKGKLPEWMQLFPSGHYRKRDRVVARVMLFAAVAVLIFIFYSTQCELSSAANASVPCESQRLHDSVATGYFTVLLITIPTGLVWLLLGLGGLVGVVLIFFYGVFTLLRFFIVLVVGSMLGVPQMAGADITVRPEIAASSLLLPTAHQQVLDSIGQDEEIMADPRKDITIIGFGDVGSRLLPLFAQAAYALEVQSSLLGSSLVDVDRTPAETVMQVPGLDFRPQSAWMQQVLAEKSADAAYKSFAYNINESVVRAYQQKHGGTIIVAAPSSLLPALYEPLCQLKQRLSTVRLLIITIEPNDQLCDMLADAGMATYDCQSGEDLKEKAIAILGMNTAHQYSCNPMPTKIEQKLLSHALRIGVLSRNAHVKGILRPRGEQREVDCYDLLQQATEYARLAMEEVCKQDTVPVFLLFVLPISDALPKFQEIVDRMNSHLASAHPSATGVFISSNQTSARGFRCGVHAVYPLADSQALSGQVHQAPNPASQSNGTSRQARISAPAMDVTGLDSLI